MFQSVRRYALEAGIDDPVVCYQGAVVAEPVSGRWLRHVPIPLELAREAIAAVTAKGFGLNCYVDDELYVAERDAGGARRYADFQHLELHRSATCSTGSTGRRRSSSSIGDPDVARRARSSGCSSALRRPPLHLQVAAVLPRVRVPDVTKAAGLEFLAEQLGFTPRANGRVRRRRERHRARRLGRLRRGRRRTRTTGSRRSPTSSAPPSTRKAWLRCSRRYLDSRA